MDNSASLEILWEQTYPNGDEEYDDILYSVTKTSSGGFLFAGKIDSWGTRIGDAWLVKINSTGEIQWTQTYGNDDSQSITDVIEVSEGGYIWIGERSTPDTGAEAPWVVKIDTEGSIEWEKKFDFDYLFSTIVDISGEGYICAGQHQQESGDSINIDAVLVKLDEEGSIEWEQRYSPEDSETYGIVNDAIKTSDDNYVLVGKLRPSGYEEEDTWLVKVDTDGTLQWKERYGDDSKEDRNEEGNSIIETSDGKYLTSVNSTPFGNTHGQGSDARLLKVGRDGSVQWEQTYNTQGTQTAVQVVELNESGYLLIGSTKSNQTDEPIVRFVSVSQDGGIRWEQTYGSEGSYSPNNLIQTGDKTYLSAGTFEPNNSARVGWLAEFGITKNPTTQTSTVTPIDSLQESVTPTVSDTIPDSNEYPLEEGSKVTVNPTGTPLYVIQDIPNVDPDRRAVTTTNYELVGKNRTKDALTAEFYQNSTEVFDFSNRLQTARNHKSRVADLQLFGRVVDAGWDVTVILSSLLVNRPDLGLGSAISLTSDAINWSVTEYNEPFEEGFTKMTATLTNAKSIQAKAQQMRTDRELANQIGTGLEAFALGVDIAQTQGGLTSAWDEAITALQQSQFPTNSVDDAINSADDLAAQSVDDAITASSGLVLGFAIDTAVGEVESGVKAKTKIHTAELAYETVRIPLLERLEVLQSRAEAGELTYPQSVEYELFPAIELQMKALLAQIGADYWEAISSSATGLLWDVVSNADSKATNFETTANSLETASKWSYLGAGANTRIIEDRFTNTINMEFVSGGEE